MSLLPHLHSLTPSRLKRAASAMGQKGMKILNDVKSASSSRNEEEVVFRSDSGRAHAKSQAPVKIFHVGRKMLEVEKMRRVLTSEKIIVEICDVENDLPNKEAIIREAKGYALPCLFVGGNPVGGNRQLERLLKSENWRDYFTV